MSKSDVIKLCVGIIIVLIICIPEMIKTVKENSVMLSCTDTLLSKGSHSSKMVNVSFVCILQKNEDNFTHDQLESFMSDKRTISATIVRRCVNMSHIHSKQFNSAPGQSVHEERKAKDDINRLMEMKGKYRISSYEKFHVILVSSEEDTQPSASNIEIYIANVSGHNPTTDAISSYLPDELRSYDMINISLQFYSNTPYFTSTLGIVWLCLLPLIFICALFMFIYKMSTQNRDW
ncbi:uncharacterized protein LOC134566061 [Pelobates fuscus]|uniref:uncharacterized protein LOC134566061 n=1 Tax=Pelobates fuscus TaxID=191477 RepID=UPI002FE45854